MGHWNEVDEDDAEPVVEVEVDDRVFLDERPVLLDAADDRDVGTGNLRRNGDGVEVLVDELRQLRESRDDVDDDDRANDVLDRAQLLGQHRVTHADVSSTKSHRNVHKDAR